MKYYTFDKKNNKKFHDFLNKNAFWAFSEEQLQKGLKEFKLDNVPREELGQYLNGLPGGGFLLKSKSKEFHKIIHQKNKVRRKYLNVYKNLVKAFEYEMGNYECHYTGDYTKSLYVLGFDLAAFRKNKKVRKAYFEAKNNIIAWHNKYDN